MGPIDPLSQKIGELTAGLDGLKDFIREQVATINKRMDNLPPSQQYIEAQRETDDRLRKLENNFSRQVGFATGVATIMSVLLQYAADHLGFHIGK